MKPLHALFAGEVCAWAFLDREMALKQARAADAGTSRGLLHGVPVGLQVVE